MAVAAGVGVGPATGPGQGQCLQQAPASGRTQQQALGPAAGGQGQRGQPARQAAAGDQTLVVAEVAAPGVAAQCMGAVHVLGVDGGHHEGAGPGAQQRVVGGRVAIGLGRALEARRQRKRVGHQPGGGRVAGGLLEGGQRAGRSAAGQAAAHSLDAPLHPGQRRTQPGLRLVLQVDHAQVEGDGVEAAGEDDARAAGRRRALQQRDHAGHPGRLAAQVQVVGAGVGAGRDQGLAMPLVGADGGDHRASLPHQRGHVGCVAGIGAEQGHAVGRADLAPQRCQLGAIATGQGPAQGAAAAAHAADQVLGHQPAGEAGGTEDDQVEGAGGGGDDRGLAGAVRRHAESSHGRCARPHTLRRPGDGPAAPRPPAPRCAAPGPPGCRRARPARPTVRSRSAPARSGPDGQTPAPTRP